MNKCTVSLLGVLMLLLFTGCANLSKKPTAPGISQPPTAQTTQLNDAINDLEIDLNKARTRAEKIQILLEALYENEN